MGQTTVENPDVAGTYTTDDRGRVTLGTDYANEEVFVVVEITNKE